MGQELSDIAISYDPQRDTNWITIKGRRGGRLEMFRMNIDAYMDLTRTRDFPSEEEVRRVPGLHLPLIQDIASRKRALSNPIVATIDILSADLPNAGG